jgi:LacI family transcriptional regulator
MATIYDVAKAAGVSPKTVSRVLSGDAPVGRSTWEVVQEAIAKLGYFPSNAA